MTKHVVAFMLSGLLSLGAIPSAHAEEGFLSWLFTLERRKEVAPVTTDSYLKECKPCHFPYQPGLLPESSWRKLMAPEGLARHFGENAELDEATRTEILNFLVANSADKSYYKRSRKIMGSLKDGEAPLRITEIDYFVRKHRDIPRELYANTKVKSLSYCERCHLRANEGDYDDDTVVIPGHGNWTW